ncbi:isoprenylcysteine carboxylmethyltransferase family protein [Promethearchaeum syntrophicum]|uniref:Isoprenylcysteine carboxylmethyltransferase family protein n=1 Tax=Promethearchaeum syntrophicum TaxID=2594042 RepID=A0A5B9DDX2_9ARCH|nr:isoprenylcysteine carboxylmethyltransferase family protein [Candidatus Prometheoarchaeum syntrophicum]QEE16990.1 Isoprenylcysteine carboxyl methyltransferase (ICMT) family protein [Candidatus Prometheoarchaeum syntrophicum]
MSKIKVKKVKSQNQGIFTIIRDLFQSIFSLMILFLAAGTFNWRNGRIYLIIILLHHVAKIILLYIFNPALFQVRTEIFTENTKKYDRIFIYCFIVLSLLFYIIAGFDAVRFQWSSFDNSLIYLGIPIFLIGWIIGIWAMIANKNFTMTVSVDKNRYLCDTGPYKIIRHPGYTGEIIMILSVPLIFGSAWSYIPAALLIIIFIVRTHFEDKLLQKELPGYDLYSKKTKFRLIPLIW